MKACFIALILLLGSRVSMADIVVQSLSPDTSVSSSTNLVGTDPVTGAGRYVVNIDISMPSAAVRTIRVTSNSNDIIVRANIEATGSGSVASVVFQGDWPTGEIESIEEIIYRDPSSGTAADISPTIRLHPTAGTGRVGGASSGCEIQFHSLSIEECRELTADLVRVPGDDPGNITLVRVKGDVTSDFIEGDTITEINVTGDIGASGNLVRIDADTNLVTLRATNLYADLNVDANVGQISVFGSSAEGTVEATDAVFGGTLDCDTMNGSGGLRVWGDLEATVHIADEMIGAAARIAVGRELAGNVTIGNGGMSRGITIGWMDSATGVWSGSVTVAGETLAPKPEYTQDVEGDGAVGVVPYGLHKFDSFPKYTGSVPGSIDVTGTETKEITIAHYGYVRRLATGDLFTITEAAGSHCFGTCLHSSNVDVTDNWALDSVGPGTANLRHMIIEGPIVEGRHYHVAVDGTLECWDVFGEPGTATTPYLFIFNTH